MYVTVRVLNENNVVCVHWAKMISVINRTRQKFFGTFLNIGTILILYYIVLPMQLRIRIQCCQIHTDSCGFGSETLEASNPD
jgi:hypothetical protein